MAVAPLRILPCPAMSSPHPPPLRRNTVFAIVAMALLMMSIDSTIVATALHAIQQGLGASINLAGWTITAYSFGFVVMLPVSGRLAQRFGKRRVFVASALVFTLVSLGCGLAQGIHELIVLRVLQAVGGAGFTPTATGIIVDHFGSSRDRYVSLFGSIFPIGAMAGPIFGGYFVAYLSWRDVFFVNVPIGLAIILLALRHIPPDGPPRATRKADIPGVLLLGASLLAGMLAVTLLGERHDAATLPAFLACLAVAAVAAALFFRHIHRAAEPFIEPRFIHGRHFGAVNLVNMIYTGSIIGGLALVPLYATSRYGIDALGSGTLLTAQGIAAAACSLLAVVLLRRTGYRRPLYAGSVVTIAGLALLALPPPGGLSPYGWLAFAAFLVGAGNGAINPAMRNAGLQLAPESSPMIAALRTLSLQIGSMVTVAVVAAILAHQEDMGRALAAVYAALALIRLAALRLVRHVPEQRGAW